MNCIFKHAWGCFLPLGVLMFVLAGCDAPTAAGPEVADPTQSINAPVLAETLDKTARILTEIVSDPEVVSAIGQGVRMHRLDGHDEQVPFANLLGRNAKAKAYAKIGEPFATAFRKAAQGRFSEEVDAKSAADDLEQYLVENNVVIYWPYSENFQMEAMPAPVVAPHPLDEDADVISAYPSVELTSAKYESELMLIDEQYAIEYPVLIVAPGDEYGYPTSTDPTVGTTTPSGDVVRVSLGYVQCRQNFDSWASGGPELDFIRLEVDPVDYTEKGYRFAPTKIEVRPSRGDCKYKRWKNVGTGWDSNWEARHKDQGFVIFDRDKFGTMKVSLNLGYKGKIKGADVDGTFNGSYTIGNDDVIYRNPINRDSFLAFNRTNVDGLGMKDGFAIRGGGTGVRYTLRHAVSTKADPLAGATVTPAP